MIDPSKVCLFIGPGLKAFKLNLFERIGSHIEKLGGSVIKGDFAAVEALPAETIPIIGCSPEFSETVPRWRREGRQFIYWDRGYARRVFATWLPRGDDGGYYRWHVNAYQMQSIRDVSGDRWEALKQPISSWARNPDGHIHIAAGSPTYERFHRIEGWVEKTVTELKKYTGRKITISDKETKEPLSERIKGAHALVTHGSNAATEAVIMGCPVFVHPDSAAALVGQTDLRLIDTPNYPDRERWANSLAYSQFSEAELVNGVLWQLIS